MFKLKATAHSKKYTSLSVASMTHLYLTKNIYVAYIIAQQSYLRILN